MDFLAGLQPVAGIPGKATSSDPVFGAKPTVIGESGDVGQADFAEALQQAGNEFVATLEKAETVSLNGIGGQASAYEVATAVMEAEQSLRMAVAVRDKIVAAYLEISRMQI